MTPRFELDARTLSDALRSGCSRLIGARERLNAINVFPVADADTGTNLAFTAQTILEALQGEAFADAGRLLSRVADAALDGARGNSGAIFAQFLLGFADSLESATAIGVAAFARAASAAAMHAREALSEPSEGTILTAMQCFATECSSIAASRAGISFQDLFRQALPAVASCVENTRDQLESLRKAMVVDAGAQGFFDWLSGIAQYLETGVLESTPMSAMLDTAASAASRATTGTLHRFCAECIVSADALDLRQLREAVSSLGASLVIAGNARKARVHLHVDNPDDLFDAVARFGMITDRKADDMRGQQRLARRSGLQSVGILTDSAADIPSDDLHRLSIHVVPLRIHFGERTLIDGVSLSAEEFYREFAVGGRQPKTSQPPAGDFRRAYEFLASHFDAVVAVCLSGKMSGTLATAKAAAARLPERDRVRVTVIDSMSASLGQGLLVMDAAESARSGASAEQIIERIQRMMPRTSAFGLVATLDYAVRGGRLPKSARFVARVIGATPIIAMNADGSAGAGGVLWGRGHLGAKFAAFTRRRMSAGKRYRVIVGHANSPWEGQALLDAIIAGRNNIERADLTTLGAVLGVHGGPGMLLVGLQERD